MDFSCVQECSNCCVEREYYPTKEFGKVGVLILPKEKKRIESLADKNGIKLTILPRIGISKRPTGGPDEIIGYQMMGKDENGNTCPFLDCDSANKSPHGGLRCKIYENRPLACRAYPVIDSNPIILDAKCKFCSTCNTPSGNLNQELESLAIIQEEMKTSALYIWRYATGIGEKQDRDKISHGWLLG